MADSEKLPPPPLQKPPNLKRTKTIYVTGGATDEIKDFFTLGKQLGTPGTFGKAVTCRRNIDKQEYACKIINKAKFSHMGELGACWLDMKCEIDILRNLEHPNVVEFIDVFEDRLTLYIVTELCRGEELFERIQKRDRYTERLAADIFFQILNGVNYIHSQGVVHCDLKPDNFLFHDKSETATLKIIDFGLSKRLPRLETLNRLCGTAYYTAPEVLQKKYAHPADTWSCGVVLFVMLFGYPPFHVNPALCGKAETMAIHNKIKKGFDPVIKNGWGAHFPEKIPISQDARDLISILLDDDPANRPTAEEALDHPWILNRETNDAEIPATVVKAIKKFQNSCAFKMMICDAFKTKLRPYQVKAAEKTFEMFDVNKDGKITLQEFKQVLLNFKQEQGEDLAYTDEDIEEMFSKIDMNDDNGIEYQELLTATYAEHLQAQDERLYQEFSRIDENADGYISPKEMKQVLEKESGFDDSKIQQAVLTIKEIDANEDGKVDWDEFLKAINPSLHVAETPQAFYMRNYDSEDHWD